MKTAAALLIALLLAACGGGDPEDRPDTDPVDCKATPEKCI